MLYEVITGKSTLLKTILGIQKPLSGEVHLDPYLFPGYFEQEAGRYNSNTALEEVWNEYPAMNNREVRARITSYNVCYTKLLR